MNRCIFFVFGFFLAVLRFTYAQVSFDRVYTNHNDVGVSLLVLHGDYYIVSNGEYVSGLVQTRITSWNNKGELRFSLPFLGYGVPRVEDAITTSDHKIVVTGTNHGCDYLFDHKFLSKFDTNGTAIFKTHLQVDEWDKMKVVELLNGHFFVTSGKFASFFDNNGTFYDSATPTIDRYHTGISLVGGDLLYSADYNNNSSLVRFDLNGSVVNHVAAPVSKKLLKTSSGYLSLVGDSAVQKYTAGLLLLSTYTTPFGIADVVAENDTIYLLGRGHEYQVTDTNFTQIHYTHVPVGDKYGARIVINQSRTGIMSNVPGIRARSGIVGKYFGLTAFPRLQSWNYTPDLVVVDFSNNFSFLKKTVENNYTNIDASFELDVEVKNVGTEPIYSFYLNADFTTSYLKYCVEPYYHRKFNFSVLPGKSVKFSSGRYDVRYYKNLSGEITGTELEIDTIKLWTSMPNLKFDADPSNDLRSKNLVLPLMTDIENYELNSLIQVYPNPVENEISVSAENNISKIELWDIKGSLFLLNETGKRELNLNVADLSPGIYLLKIFTSEGIAVRKIVKN